MGLANGVEAVVGLPLLRRNIRGTSGGSGQRGLPLPPVANLKSMTPTSTPAAQNETAVRRLKHRCGGCAKPVSAVRPVSSSFPAHFQSPDADPKGFIVFGGRTNFSRS